MTYIPGKQSGLDENNHFHLVPREEVETKGQRIRRIQRERDAYLSEFPEGVWREVPSHHQGDTARLIIGSVLRLGYTGVEFDFTDRTQVSFKLGDGQKEKRNG